MRMPKLLDDNSSQMTATLQTLYKDYILEEESSAKENIYAWLD